MALRGSVPARSRVRSWLAASLAAGVVLLALVGPAAAARGPVRLTDPSVSPVQVTAGARITFSVVYSNGQGNGPASIVVKVGSAQYTMSAPSGSTNYGGGVTYTVVASPPAGTWPVEFTATDKFGNTASLAGASVTVVAPPPPSTPPPTSPPTSPPSTPPPTSPPSTPPPTSPPSTPPPAPGGGGGTVGPGGAGSSDPGGSTGAPGSGSSGSPADGASGGSTGGSSSVAPANGTPAQLDDILPPWQTERPALSAYAAAGATAAAASDTAVPDAVVRPFGGAVVATFASDDWKVGWTVSERGSTVASGSRKGLGPGLPAAAVLPGMGAGITPEQILTTTVVTMGGVAMTMAFMLFGRRRRDDEPTDTDEALAAAAASGAGAVATGSLLAGMGGRPAVAVAPVPDAELDLPRWRRPSLLAARKEDPLRAVRTDVKLTFDHGAVAPIDGVERRSIRYRLVRLLDSPDEVVAGEVGLLDEGDEVQLLQRSGAYWLVLCPDGRQGWVHRMVLGDVVAEGSGADDPPTGVPSPRSPLPGERASASVGPAGAMRLGGEGSMAWSLQGAAATDAGVDVDEDVLQAYLASRGIA